MADKVLSFEEVAKHNTSTDCWLIIHAKDNPALHQVYDVSKFMEEHPGGEEVMLKVTGKDASFDFEDIGHSSYAEGLMKDLCIGEIHEDTLPEATEVPSSSSYKVKEETGDSLSTFLLYVVPPLILGAAFLLLFYSGNQ